MKEEKRSVIIGFIEDGAHVLTANRRLSRHVAALYDAEMFSRGAGAWRTPAVMPLGSWVEEFWARTDEGGARPVMGEERSAVLWEEVVRADPTLTPSRVPARALAGEALRAYTLMRDYGLELPPGIYLTKEAEAFAGWVREYEKRLEELGLTDRSDAGARLPSLMGGIKDALPDKVVLAGFDELTPSAGALAEALRAASVEVFFWPRAPDEHPEGGPVEAGLKSYPDMAEEAAGAARWARETAGPDRTVAVVVPELGRYRDLLARELSAELDPASVLPGREGKEVFNVSLGTPLAEVPVVETALALLSLDGTRAPLNELSRVFLSPYVVGTGAGLATAARVDSGLRSNNRLGADPAEVIEKIKAGGEEGLARRLARWYRAVREEARGRKAPGEWARHLTSLLHEAGFASRVSLESAEYQAVEALNKLLERVASLDDITGPLTRCRAVSILRGLASRTLHQGESRGAGVQVLGLLETAGLDFDHVLLVGCHEYALPSPPSPNPFIPFELQRKAGLPHSSHARELDFSRKVLNRLMASSGTVTVSCPEKLEDRPVGPSPLVSPAAGAGPAASASSSVRSALFEARTGEEAPSVETVPMTPGELADIRGGVQILKDQSACPFLAFARRRLGAEPLGSPEPGLTPMERGTIIHEALREFWSGVKGSEELRALFEKKELAARVSGAVDSALSTSRVEPPLSDKFINMERGRLAGLVTACLELELTRPGFTVEALEEPSRTEVSGLELRLRVDRVDRAADGSRIVIDYKTGKNASKNDWLPPRPLDPQLPLYAVTGGFDGVAFAVLAPGRLRFEGLASTADALPKVKALEDDRWAKKVSQSTGIVIDGWDGLVAEWKRNVNSLADGFTSGVVRVDPNPALANKKRGNDPCSDCDYMTLCRVLETGTGLRSEEDD